MGKRAHKYVVVSEHKNEKKKLKFFGELKSEKKGIFITCVWKERAHLFDTQKSCWIVRRREFDDFLTKENQKKETVHNHFNRDYWLYSSQKLGREKEKIGFKFFFLFLRFALLFRFEITMMMIGLVIDERTNEKKGTKFIEFVMLQSNFPNSLSK